MPSFFDTPSVPSLLGSIIPFLILDVVAVYLRFHTRRRSRQPLLTDDWLMVPALVGLVGLASMYFYGISSKALGYRWMLLAPPGAELDPEFVPEAVESTEDRIQLTRRLEYSSLVLHAAVSGLIKISVLALYRRIFVVVPHFRNGRNLFFVSMMMLIGMWSASYVFAFIFMCRQDVEVLFMDPALLMQKCVNTLMVGYSYAISDFITDGLIILIPIPFIWQLCLPMGRKIAVLGVFLMGILAAGSSLVRLAWMAWNQTQGLGPQTDEELMITTELYWMLLEVTLGVLAACLPTLRGFFKSLSMDSTARSIRTIFPMRSASDTQIGSTKSSKEGLKLGSQKSGQTMVFERSDSHSPRSSDSRV